ncbi:MAG: tRNA lysidine(34) synthetase TilS [Nitrospina sp.]|nr:tRNA lysidine(34) synthetase TilS [Nitrospina sp.]
MSSFSSKVKSKIIELITPGDKVLVAVSGGADSLALIYLLEKFSKELSYNLFVAHLNHLARGKESDQDEKFVEKVARKLSLPIFIDKIDIRNSSLKYSFQESARILRYQFLEKTLKSIKGNKIALGHTADDNIETVLMNLLRGTGLRGLSGIPETIGNVIRPLLYFTRPKLEEFLGDHNIAYRTDSSNSDTKYLRNKVRQEMIPFLKIFNPNISRSLLSLAEIARGEEQWMSEKIHELYSKLVINQKGTIYLDVLEFEKQHLAMKRRLVREIFYQLSGSLRLFTALHVQQVLDLFTKARVGSVLMFPGGVRVVCDYEKVCFSLNDDFSLSDIVKRASRLLIPGITNIAQLDIRFHAQFVELPLPESIGHMQAYFDFEKTGGNIRLRFFQPGDSFVPLGMQGHKKVKSFFIDQKIPRKKRPFIPILINGNDDIIWIYGERISDSFRVDATTKKVLFIEGKVI